MSNPQRSLPAGFNWRGYVPIVGVLAQYRRRDFSHDLAAGLIVGVITVPQAIAYAFLAGLPPQAGLYGCLLPMLIYAVLGSSRELVVGPVAIAALMVAATVGEHAPAHSDAYFGITSVLCVQVAAFLWLLRVSQMAGVVNLLSHPVVSGFVNAAAILIIVSQLKAFAGLPDSATPGVLAELEYLANNVAAANPTALALGVGALVVLWAMRRYGFYLVLPLLKRVGRNHPITRTGPMLVIVLGAVLVVALDLDSRFAVDTVGFVPAGLPDLTIPPFDAALWLALVPSSALIALVAYIESFSIGTTLAARRGRRLDANQELVALGAANLAAAFSGAYPVAGSFSRSSVNVAAGARTPVASIVSMGVIVVTLLWLTPQFARLPYAVLAAIIIAAVADLIELKPLREYWSFYPSDTVTHLVTMFGVIALGVEVGLLLGVFVAVAFFVRQSSRPHIAVVGRIGDTAQFRNVARHKTETFVHVAAVRVDENLTFANAAEVENRLTEIATRDGVRHLLLVCSAVNFIDTTGLAMLTRVNDNIERLGIRFHLSDVKGPVMDRLNTTGFPAELTGSIFFSTDLAMRELKQLETKQLDSNQRDLKERES